MLEVEVGSGDCFARAVEKPAEKLEELDTGNCSARFQMLDFPIGWATLILTAFTGIMTWMTYRSLCETKQQNELAIRPFLDVFLAGYQYPAAAVGPYNYIDIVFRNDGNGVAKQVKVTVEDKTGISATASFPSIAGHDERRLPQSYNPAVRGTWRVNVAHVTDIFGRPYPDIEKELSYP